MKVLFIDSGERYLERTRAMGKPYPHSGLGYLVTVCHTLGYHVSIVDMAAQHIGVSDMEPLLEKVSPDIVAISSMTYAMPCTYSIARLVKELDDVPVIVGGVHATLLPQQTLSECASIDYLVQGEGENALPALIRFLEGNGDIREIPNAVFRSTGHIRVNPLTYIETLDDLPFPDWSLFDYSLYHRLPTDEGGIPLYQINSSRGCPYSCTFCSPIHGKEVRYRSASSLFTEITYNHEKHDARHFDFADSNATLNRKMFMELCDLLISEGLSGEVGWSIDTHVGHLDPELLVLGRNAGLRFISIGVESGDESMLPHMGKTTTLSETESIIKKASDLGIKVKCSFILGHPYETIESAEKTANFAFYLRKKYGVEYYYNLIDVYPGTPLYTMVDNGEGGARWIAGKRNNWAAYRRDEPMIEVNDLTEPVLKVLYERYTTHIDGEEGSNFYEEGG
ncbi:MAG: B12-binding domain-containing radical SAM protein [Theionarchaea archaeon]|nr:B12-binding domain-containing radical SAM protein [Theionarchaea archaeon]